MWFFLDPSLTAIGWCVVDFSETGTTVHHAGRITLRGKARSLKNDAKIDLMLYELQGLLNKHCPQGIVIEIPSGKVHAQRHTGGGQGLSVYGFAVGHVRDHCRSWVRENGGEVIALTELEWTGGHGKKKHRLVAQRVWPKIKELSDPGSDIADAIAMADWWWTFVMRKGLWLPYSQRGPEEKYCCICERGYPLVELVEVPSKNGTVAVCKNHFKPDKKPKKGKT